MERWLKIRFRTKWNLLLASQPWLKEEEEEEEAWSYIWPCSYRSLSTVEQSLSPPEFSGLPIQSEWSFLRLSRVHVTRRRPRLCLSTEDKGDRGGGGGMESSKNHFHVHGCPHYGYMHGRATSVLETEVISREPEDRDKNRNWVLGRCPKDSFERRAMCVPFSSRICGGQVNCFRHLTR